MKISQQYTPTEGLILGLDIGTASLGWALIEQRDGRLVELRGAGVRAFEAGVEGDVGVGRDTSRAATRREKRLRRRMLARRRHRLNKLATILQRAELLPPGDLEPAETAMKFFADLDRKLFSTEARRADPHLLPYRLRARALDEKLTLNELGRAFYHLAQRRGFLSSRRMRTTARPEEKDEKGIKKEIAGLDQSIQESGARTLGEYLSKLDPEEERVRMRHLGRQMIEDEFNKIWEAQAGYHPETLTDDLRRAVHNAIFFQRPLKSQRGLIGECELEKGKRRAPWATLVAQRFRLLQKVNDLEVHMPDGQVRRLEPEERASLAEALEQKERMTFGAIRRHLGLPQKPQFNFETNGEKGLLGNRTACHLVKVFGKGRWETFTPEDREQVVLELRSIHKAEAMKRRAMKLWGLDEEAATRLAEVALEDGYCNLSKQALNKILPLMEQGTQYATARKELYGEEPGPRVMGLLPRLDAILEVRNPAVERALTEVHKVVNAIVREHGKPDRIRIELARDLKKTRKDRKGIAARNIENRKARDRAAERIIAEAGLQSPTRKDIEKWLLADECRWECPYTGKQISRETLFGAHPQFDVEHIIPFHRCLDNSFINKTLCEAGENRHRKRNYTPWEVYGSDPDRWEEIIGRVKRFTTGRAARAKLERFQIEEVDSLDKFASQQLNDTRYASRLAVRYVGLLYGADGTGVDGKGKRRVEASRGAVTFFLRNEWQLNNILGGGEKTRDDHRQHAIDAVVVALTEPGVIKLLSDAAARALREGRRRFAKMESPWPGFLDDVKEKINTMVVSHRVSRKVAGALHEETIYSKAHVDEEGKPCAHVRKRFEDLKKNDLTAIVDPAVRECVERKLEELGESNPGKAFQDPKNHPSMRAKDGREIPIHKVRIRTSVATKKIGTGAYARQVKLGSNHHVEILETTDKKGGVRWDGVVVSTRDAMHRLRAGEPVVQRDHGPDKRFLFSLAGGEIIELDEPAGGRGLYRVRDITQKQSGYIYVRFVRNTDARMKKNIPRADWGDKPLEPLRKMNCRKVIVTPLGEVRRAND